MDPFTLGGLVVGVGGAIASAIAGTVALIASRRAAESENEDTDQIAVRLKDGRVIRIDIKKGASKSQVEEKILKVLREDSSPGD